MLPFVASTRAMMLRGGLVPALHVQPTWPLRGMFQLRIPAAALLEGTASLAQGVNALSVMQIALLKGTCQSLW